MLYGYGGFNISLTPSFSIANAVWMENGGVYAVPNLVGRRIWKKWHDAGTKLQKQNVFDFIAAAEYLIAQNILLPISCHSWGVKWRLVGATMTQRPELMKVALPAVGVMDMLRYHTLRQVQVGHTIMEQHKIVKKCLNTLKAILLYTM
jgi:prolyl oligopeptidase